MRTAAVTIALASAAWVGACSQRNDGSDGAGRTDEAQTTAPTLAATTLPPDEIAVGTTPDPAALEELLNAAPQQPPPSTGPDGGTLVGRDTELPEADDDPLAGRVEPPFRPPKARLEAGRMEIQPALSNPAVERAAREQFYWPLVQKCRGPDGEILPPDAITLVFTIGPDGAVDPGSVGASAAERKYDGAADCVVREFSALPFRGPAASMGSTTRVISTLPSVD